MHLRPIPLRSTPLQARGGSTSRRGAVPLWMPIALVVLLVGMGAILLERSAARQGVARVDLARYRLHHGQAWFSPDWRQELEEVLLAHGALMSTDLDARAALRADLEALPFIGDVEPGEVLWPKGLALRVRLIEPVACVRLGGEFLPISSDGSLLPGWSDAPHGLGVDFLPVLRPTPLEWKLKAPFYGEPTDDVLLLSALSLARSFKEHLTPAERSLFGRAVFDVGASDAPDGLPGGAKILLEGERVIAFGDSPMERGPGELPDGDKWRHAVDGLVDGMEGASWAVLDVRFDTPERSGPPSPESNGGGQR